MDNPLDFQAEWVKFKKGMDRLLKIFFELKKESKRMKEIFQGSHRDPFLYLGLVSIILFGLISFGSSILNPSLNQGDFSFLAAVSRTKQSQNQSLFLSQETNKIESPNLTFVQESSLIGVSSPTVLSSKVLGGLIGSFDSSLLGESKEIIEYTVEPGDSFWKITENFDISLETLLWANDLTQKSIIQPGQKLIILPVSGVLHHVKSGDTLSEIAQRYEGQVEEIITFNDLPNEGYIFVGDILIIPNGVMPPPPKKPTPSYVPLASSYFICPIALPCKITQGLHWYNAIDFSHGKCDEAIYAAAGGEVQKTGYDRNLGNYIRISHPNGVVTLYGHLSRILVRPGDSVYQGQIIAYMGYTGRTIPSGPAGCHLHFEVRGAENPFR